MSQHGFDAAKGADTAEGLHRRAVVALAAGRTAEGIALLRQASGLRPASGMILSDLAAAVLRSGGLAEAEQLYARAATVEAGNPYPLAKLGIFLLQQNRVDEARAAVEASCSIAPNHPDVLNAQGFLRAREGDMPAAQALFLQALKTNPSLVDAHLNLGNLLRASGRTNLAEDAYRHALKLDAGNIDAMIALAESNFLGMKKVDEAVALFRKAVAQEPGNLLPRLRLIVTLEALNRVDEAFTELENAKQSFPPGPGLVMAEARLLRRQGKITDAVALLEEHEKHLGEKNPKAMAYYFELGQLYERSGDADKAFRAFTAANSLQAQSPEARCFDKGASARFIQRMRRDFGPELVRKFEASRAFGGQRPPVFLVGFPRSGTTLLDQILSSCPGVHVANETPAIDMVFARLVMRFTHQDKRRLAGLGPDWVLEDPAYPACLAALTEGDIEAMRRIFLEAHGQPAGSESRLFVDKLPLNLLHAGLINRMFPNAKFILAMRHPCDAVLSFFMQEFALNGFMVRSSSLEDAARFYDEAFGLWNHYATVLKLDVHTVRYEDVVADFRPTIAALLQYLGLEWTDAVLEYDKTAKAKGRIGTPSYHQVTQKLYTRASGRWQRYRQHMQPVLGILEPHAKSYGYSIERLEPGSDT